MTVRSLGPRGLGATLASHAQSIATVGSALGIPPVDWNAPKSFTFRRRKIDGVWGWTIGLNVGRMWLNLGCDSTDPAPHVRTLNEARGWAIEFAERHGFKAMEMKRAPRPKPRPTLRVVVSNPQGELLPSQPVAEPLVGRDAPSPGLLKADASSEGGAARDPGGDR